MTRVESRKALQDIQRQLARVRLNLKRMEERDTAPPASNSMYWRAKGEKPQEDGPWLEDGWSGKR